MYTQFFGLQQEPFSIAPDPRALYLSASHREALAHLLYGIRGGGGFVVLTGEIGAGKTTVCRALLEQVPPECRVAYIFNPRLTVPELLVTVCEEFGVALPVANGAAPGLKHCIDALNRYLLAAHARGEQALLIIDEAQNLSADVLEQLRLLTNLETNERKLLQIILVGQPELRTLLAQPELAQLAQRVIARFHLGALSVDETVQYIAHRLQVAGAQAAAAPLTPAISRRVHRLAGGIPRRINLLCDRALLGAYAEGAAQVTPRILAQAAREVLPVPPGQRVLRYLGSAAVAGIALALLVGLVQLVPLSLGEPAVQAALQAPLPDPEPDVPPSQPVAPGGVAADDAWRLMAAVWKLPPPGGDPCGPAMKAQGVHCYRATGGLAELRQLGRPAVLTLQDTQGVRSYVVLTALSLDQAWLQGATPPGPVALMALAQAWRGEFVTWWRVPPGYRGEVNEVPSPWLAEQLARVDQQPRPLAGKDLQEALQRFQRLQGLKPDGVPGPRTLMQINRFAGIDEPRLQDRSR